MKILASLILLVCCFHLSYGQWTKLPNCAKQTDSYENRNCYTTANSPCGDECRAGFTEIRKWGCGICFCEECCQKVPVSTCTTCEPGFVLSSNSCVDINECLGSVCFDGRACTNTAGSFTCGACPPGSIASSSTGCSACPAGKYGTNCASSCTCLRGICNSITGKCDCTGTGFSGDTCNTPICGDGILVAGEICEKALGNECCGSDCTFRVGVTCTDDNNPCTNDVCNSNGVCTHTPNGACRCGDGDIDPGEECDSPNQSLFCTYGVTSCQVCNSTSCKIVQGIPAFCGDSILTDREECDDGNAKNGDGCSSSCKPEDGYYCPQGSPCTPCTGNKFGSGCLQQCNCNTGACDPVNGACTCFPPWKGNTCNSIDSPAATEVTSCTTPIQALTTPSFTATGAFATIRTRILLVFAGTACLNTNSVIEIRYSSSPTTLTSSISRVGVYDLCLSYNEGLSYVKQTGIQVSVVAPTPTSQTVTEIIPNIFQVQSRPVFRLEGTSIFTGAKSFVAFSSDNCSSQIGKVNVASILTFLTLSTAINTPGNYSLCYSTDDTNYVRQNIVILITTLDASFVTIETIDPAQIPLNTIVQVEVGGKSFSPAANVRISFSKTSCSSNRIADTQFSTNKTNLSQNFSETGSYIVCYSTDSGAKWVPQTLVSIEVLPPPATNTSITSISPNVSFALSAPIITFNGAVPSSRTQIALIPEDSTNCSASFAVTNVPLNSTIILSSRIDSPGKYKICYKTESSFVLQNSLLLELIPPIATSKDITSLSTFLIEFNSTTNISFIGAVPYQTTYVGFYKRSNPSSLLSPTNLLNNVVSINFAGFDVGLYDVAYSTNGGSSYVTQTEVFLEILPGKATNSSITSLSPSTFSLSAGATVTFTNSQPSLRTLVSFTLSNCSQPELTVLLNSSSVSVNLIYARTYLVCYSTNSGDDWFLQTLVNIDVIPDAATQNSISSISPSVFDIGSTQSFSLAGGIPHSTTFFGFALNSPSNCSNPLYTTNYNSPPTEVNHFFNTSNIYYICYSTNGGKSYFGQSSPTLFVKAPDARNDSISDILVAGKRRSSEDFIVGNVLTIEAIGAVPSIRSVVKFTTLQNCEGGIDIPYTSVPAKMLKEFSVAGVHYICYSTDSRGTWVLQKGLTLFVRPPPSTPVSVSPFTQLTLVISKSPTTLLFSGAVPSNSTYVAIVQDGIDCATASPQSIQPLANLTTAIFSNVLTSAGFHEICYSTDGTSTWSKQVFKIETVPPEATLSDITRVIRLGSPPTSSAPAEILYGLSGQKVTIVGGIPSRHSKIAFVSTRIGVCGSSMVGISNYTSTNLTIESPISSSGLFFACYSTDGGNSFQRQRSIINVIPALPNPNTIQDIYPKILFATLSQIFEFNMTGFPASAISQIAFVRNNKECAQDNLIINTKYDRETLILPSFTLTGIYELCISATLGATWVKQVSPNSKIEVLPPAARSDSITLLSPPSIPTKNSSLLILIGSVPSIYTYVAFTLVDQCAKSNFIYVLNLNDTYAPIDGSLDVGEYYVCYSTGKGEEGTWFLQVSQTGPIKLRVDKEIIDGGGSNNSGNLPAIIGGAVGGLIFLIILVALVVGCYWRSKSRKLKKLEKMGIAMEPNYEPPFASQNPVYQNSDMYESRVSNDPMKSK